MFGIKEATRLSIAKLKWRRRNSGNGTYLDAHAVGFDNISVGDWSYGPLRIVTSSPNPSLRIGSFCSIAEGVSFITCDEHPLDHFSSFPFRVRMLGESMPEAIDKGGIIVEDDVWIGYGATVLDGVKIGRGGGCRCGGPRCERRGALYDCWRSASQANQKEIQPRGYRSPARARLHEGGQRIRGGAPRAALPPVGRMWSQGAVR